MLTDASADPSGRLSAYALVYNATLPSQDLIGDDSAPLNAATATVKGTQFARLPELTEAQETDPLATFRYNRAGGKRFQKLPGTKPALRSLPTAAEAPNRPTIPGAGNPANGGSAAAGYNYCVYVPR